MAARALLALALLGLALAAVPLGDGGGPTYIEGTVAGVPWTPEGSPYFLVGNATVPPDVTLVVQAGVEVRANRGVHLAVQGTLLVLGTPDAPVRFGANATAADAGFWRGIHGMNFQGLMLEHAILDDAEAGLTVFGGSASLVGSSLTGNFRGLHVQSGAATVLESSISQNTQAGLFARSAVVTVRNGLLADNKVGMDLAGAQVLAENTTFLGPTTSDLSLDLGSVAALRASALEAPIKFVDSASRVDVEGILAVSVTDAYGTPIGSASVVVEDNPNGSARIGTTANHEGRVPGLVVLERRVTMFGTVDFNPFMITASVTTPGGTSERTETVTVHRAADVTLAIPVDVAPPTPVTARFVTADEDAIAVFDATASTDNDPNLASTGTFAWSFPELGLVLTGITASHRFPSPGLYQGVLTVTDAAGNEAVLTFAVQVVDITPPAFTSVTVPERGALGATLAFEAAATDNDPGAPTAAIEWRFARGDRVITRNGERVEVAFDGAGPWTVTVTARDRTGNEISRDAVVEVVAPPPLNPWPYVAGGAALLAAAIGLATERGKVGFLTLFLPLYTRIKDEEVLDQFTRGQIYGYIRVHPGDTYTDIKRNLVLNNGTLTYHLDVLERQQLIRAITRGPRKMFYPTDVQPPQDGGGLHEIQQRLLRGIGEAPGIAVTDLAASLGISRQLALYHLRLLAARRLVRLERHGVKLCGVPVGSSVGDVGGRLEKSP